MNLNQTLIDIARGANMIKYKANSSFNEIEEVEVVRETEKCVYVQRGLQGGERRESKLSSYDNYFSSWDEAHEFLLEQAQRTV